MPAGRTPYGGQTASLELPHLLPLPRRLDTAALGARFSAALAACRHVGGFFGHGVDVAVGNSCFPCY